MWQGHGPLAHVLSLDCAPVSRLLPDLGLPTSGTLAFFYFDGSYDDFAGIVGTWDASSRPGFRVLLHVAVRVNSPARRGRQKPWCSS